MARTLYEVRPPLGKELDVVATYERIYGYVEIAAELWRLLGNKERAVAIEDVITEAHVHDIPAFRTDELNRLLDLVSGLDAAVVGPFTDAAHQLSLEKVVELRSQTELLDVGEGRGADAQWAVKEALFRISQLQDILRSAIEGGTYLVLD